MAYMARSFGYAPGMGAAAAGGFPGLSPQTLAFIEGLKQQQRQAETEARRHDQQMEMMRQRFDLERSDRTWKQVMEGNKAADERYYREKGEKKQADEQRRANMLALYKIYSEGKKGILGSADMPRQKMEQIGALRNEIATMGRFVVGEDFNPEEILGPQP